MPMANLAKILGFAGSESATVISIVSLAMRNAKARAFMGAVVSKIFQSRTKQLGNWLAN